ncbi:MAG: DM13 domain-containing protein [Pseudomonadales bacterium]
MQKKLLGFLAFTHITTLAVGFALGIYVLPILTAPPAPTDSEIRISVSQAVYTGEFITELKGSDALHWGEGKLSVSLDQIALMGQLAPGPDYQLYLSPQWVETEVEFMQLKASMLRVGAVKTFDHFIVPMAPNTDLTAFNTVVVWCETFGEFITAAQYR